ncbi:histidinol dehydrogenase [Clostridium chrysemydis]|uniref:histidinol dehydrogenase n=1 Tax=Clostridium chrysemydis TaxID=2665504 RepID=UPI001884855A|nr:histidinol dehydrogenase [Clostridium chrysemydis]
MLNIEEVYYKDLKWEDFLKSKNSISEIDQNKTKIVKEIIENVRVKGDKALREYTKKFDKVEAYDFLVSDKEFEEAFKNVSSEFIENIKEAKENILEYHNLQKPIPYRINRESGTFLGRKVTPLERIGLYVPGGTASYPSSVLMNAIPAIVAGVSEIVIITPPDKNNKINPYVLVTSKILGIDKVYKIGGAQGIAALAYGTESIKKVLKIVGPGNIYVSLAKREVFGEVDIDMIAGPSEILIIADENSNPKYIAADLMSQAEHDILASAILITTSKLLAKKVKEEINKALENLSRRDIILKSLNDFGKIIIIDDIEEAFTISNEIAPEHLEILLDYPSIYLEKIKNAGSIFLGEYSPEPVGDYFAGTNHVLPTGGTAKFSSPLSVEDFMKKSSYVFYSKEDLLKNGEKIIGIANKEGLTAHSFSVKVRLEDEKY